MMISFSVSGQGMGNYYLRTNTIVSITSCAGFIYDSGGPNANYSDNSDARIEVFSAQSGFMVTVSGTIWLETGDTLIIYDGAGIGGTILFKGTSPSNGTALTIPTYTSTTGPLTIRFITNGSGNAQGVELMISCIDQNVYVEDPPEDTASCINFTDLTGSQVTCYYGDFSNPYANTGVAAGRHQVITNVNQVDPYSNGGLYCVRPGEIASVQLGNSSVGAQAEAIMYEYYVDTNNYDILVLKYAAVLQDPSHTAAQQPRFTFQILNSQNVEIDPVCGSADFISGNTTDGWHNVNSLFWKDWTSVGIDLSAYHRQTIRIRLTTYDCSQSGHFGYAYFSFECKKRKISVETCGNIQQNTYTAPDGFHYRWYYSDDPGVTLSTNRSYTATVGMQSHILYCDVSFVDNASCHFTLFVNVSPRYPLADFTYSRVGCSNTLFLNNTSRTSADGLTPDGSGNWCETAYWDFGNGTTSNLYSPTAITYPAPGTYTITMIAGLANNQCLDTVRKVVTIFPNTVQIAGNAEICKGDTTTLSVAAGDYVYWNSGQTTHTITVAPESDRTYTVAATTADGCYATGRIDVHVHPTYYSEQMVTLEDNQTYFFNGQWINSTGVYYEQHQTVHGCDSIIKLTIHRRINQYVSICSTEVYSFMGMNLSQTGVYTDSVRFANGCDSVYRLHLIVNPIYFFQTNHNMCDNQSFLWRDSLVENLPAGLHLLYDSMQTAAGCDSIYCLRLIVRPTTRIYVYDTICQGQSLRFLTQNYTVEGVYEVTQVQANGCDRVLQLNLKVHPVYLIQDTIAICDDQTYNFRGRILSQPGIYYDSLQSVYGCDSIYKLVLQVNPNYLFIDSAIVCDNQPYLFRGRSFSQSGVYDDTLVSSKGCDSIYRLHLTVYPTYFIDETATICDNQTYTYHGRVLSQAGIYFDSLQTSHGCDSIHRLTLQVNPTYFFRDNATICNNQTYNFRGRALTQAGIYYDSLSSSLFCDSVYELNLQVNPTYLIETFDTICDNQTFNFRGRNLNLTGIYYDSLQTFTGCDSVYKLNLQVNPTHLIETFENICDNQTFNFRGRHLNLAGVYYDSLLTSHGCDSVYKLNLQVNPTYLIETFDTICDNQTFNFRGRDLNLTGIYYDSLLTLRDCDSIYKLYLQVNPTHLIETFDTICDNQTFNFRGRNLNLTGVYYDSLQTSFGCDSIYKLNLQVSPTYLIETFDTICDNQTFNFRGRDLNQMGIYYDSLLTSHSCDSVYKLNLHINPTYLIETFDTICDNQTFNFRGRNLNLTGIYYDSLFTSLGCDSIYKLNLQVNPTYLIETFDTICDNQIFNFRGRNLNLTGIYYDSLQTSVGCDSIYRLNLQVNPTYLIEMFDTICDNQTFNFRGRNLNLTGIYYDSLQTFAGCDSVYKLNLQVNPTYLIETFDTICDNQTFNFRGRNLNLTGIYYDSLFTSLGCDSIYKLNLQVNPTYLIETFDTICDNQTFNFRGQDLSVAGIYYDSLQTSVGCDSIYKLNLHVNSTYLIVTFDTICDNQTFNFRGQILSQTGVYYDSLLTVNGCDSVYELNLQVNPTYLIADTMAICNMQHYNFRGQLLTQPGVYYDSLISSKGCDSVYRMELQVTQVYMMPDSAAICDNQTYNFRGQVLTQAGVYYDSLVSSTGCDSIYRFKLTVNPTYFLPDSATICDNQTYNFRGQVLTQAGVYYDSLLSSTGCDSIYQLTLFVNPTYLLPDSATICDNQTYNFRGQILTQAGIYYDSLLTANGCDSVYQLTLFVNPTYLLPDSATICDNQTYNFRGQIISQAGIYYDSLLSSTGCDSVYQLTLFVNPTYLLPDSATICDNQTYNFRGQVLTQVGVYYDSLLSSTGCDSIYQLTLFVNPTYLLPDSATICDNQTYNFRGQIISQAGVYYDSLLTSNGCDSVYRLTLYVVSTFFFPDSATICDNQTYNFRGQVLTQAGIYYDSLISSTGCDSVYQLTLFVNPTYFFPDSATICDNQTYNFRGQILSQAGIYYDSLLTANGCDSVYRMNLHVNPTYFFPDNATICDNQTYNFRGQILSQAGIYYDSLLTADGCDSVYQLTLHVVSTYFFPNNATICDNQTYNFRGQVLTQAGIYYDSLLSSTGCDSVYQLTLFVNPTYFIPDSATICDNQTYNFRGQVLSQAGIYYDSLLTSAGCDSVYQLTLFVNPTDTTYLQGEVCQEDDYIDSTATFFIPADSNAVSGQFTYTRVLPNVNGCDSLIILLLTVNPTFDISISDTICQGDTYTENGFNLSAQDSNGSHTYELHLQTVSGCDSTIHLMLHVKKSYYQQHDTAICQGYPFNNFGFVLGEQEESGDFTYQLDLTSQEGCDSVITLNLSVVDVGVSIDIFESDFCEDGSVTLVANTLLPNILWSTGETTSSILVQQAGRYFVTASSGACSSEDAIVIEPCSLQLFIPSSITPSNQDGLNDYFFIPLPKNHQIIEFEVVIYNRWGEAIFSSKDYNFRWDGKYKGKFIPNQVFTYRIIVVTQNGNDYLFKGIITVL